MAAGCGHRQCAGGCPVPARAAGRRGGDAVSARAHTLVSARDVVFTSYLHWWATLGTASGAGRDDGTVDAMATAPRPIAADAMNIQA
jgi:hypothetical protein